jgi:HD superfamily phosphodiesterase
MDENTIRETLAGYAAADAFIEAERIERLARMTQEEADAIARDLEASWEASARSQEGLERLEAWRMETKLRVRRAFLLLARARGLI